MRTWSKLITPLVFLFAASSLLAGPAEDRVASAFTAWNSAFNAGHAKTVAAFYAPDAVVLPASHDIVGSPADIEKFFAGLIANHVTGHVLQPFKIIEVGDTMIVASKWSANGQDDKGNKTTLGGLATHVFQKQSDKSYKLKLHTFN
jgi:ketosteroid isomerase-like protein